MPFYVKIYLDFRLFLQEMLKIFNKTSSCFLRDKKFFSILFVF